ncbi:hypothetical protein F8M41_017352 [Gigaspora margarita]|uniref:BED-type domain-containing protein n=1 Tax=Gigaspora margarita TaxID=4874 RepID=A0A8H4AN57_GIGMA|nr:hypothetical protein F8M41_017352 [Gigaspora margarita]
MFENQNLISDSDDENDSGNSRVQQSRRRSVNNHRKSICWSYFKLIQVPGNETVVECTKDGCNTKYVWRGSTSNLLGHLKRKHHVTTESLTSARGDENSSGNSGVQRSRRRSRNNCRKSIFWRYFKLIKDPGNKTVVECTIDGCSTKYTWRGSTSNLLYHLKRKHATQLFTALNINILKSSGFINPQIELPLEEQVDQVYRHLSDQLKSEAQNAKTVMLSLDRICEFNVATCCWLTENFEFNKILLCVNKISKDIIEVLDSWKLKNLKFISSDKYFYDRLKEKHPDIIHYDTYGSGNNLIVNSLSRWASENISAHGISNIVKAVKNATGILCHVVGVLKNKRMQNEMNITNITNNSCNCHDHKIEFLSLISQHFKQLFNNNNYDNFIKTRVDYFKRQSLDNLPFSIFCKLVELFKPLKHIEKVTERNVMNLLVIAHKILKEISCFTASNEPFQLNLEYKTLESFLKFLIHSYGSHGSHFHWRVSLFLDPCSKQINLLSDEMLLGFVLDKCQAYYSQNPSFSGNNLAFEELTQYISRLQSQFDENIDVCEWWQNSKHEFPGLATLAKEYLPLMLDKELKINKFKKFIQNDDKIAFLGCNMNHIDLR